MDFAYFKKSLQQLRFVSNFHDARELLYGLVLDGSQWVSAIRQGGGSFTGDSLFDENNFIVPKMHWTLRILFALLFLSILFRNIYILTGGIWVVLADQIIGVACDWIVFALDDPELSFALRYIRGWFRRFVRESESILKNDAAWKMGVAHAFLRQVPTGISVIRYYIFYRNFELRDIFLREELGASRHADQNQPLRFLPRGESWSKRYRQRKSYIQETEIS